MINLVPGPYIYVLEKSYKDPEVEKRVLVIGQARETEETEKLRSSTQSLMIKIKLTLSS